MTRMKMIHIVIFAALSLLLSAISSAFLSTRVTWVAVLCIQSKVCSSAVASSQEFVTSAVASLKAVIFYCENKAGLRIL